MTGAVALIAFGLCLIAAVVAYGGSWLDED